MSLKISTKKSLYKPITIEIDGKVLEARPLNRKLLEEIHKIEKDISSGKTHRAYDELKLIFGDHPEFDQLDIRYVNEIILYVTRKIYAPEKLPPEETEEEKNLKGPGDKG